MAQIIDLGKLRLTFLGEYSGAVTYSYNDIVTYGGNSYCYTNISVSSGIHPTNVVYWSLMAAGLRWTGSWIPSKEYLPQDIVTDGSSSWIAQKVFISGSISIADDLFNDADSWLILAAGGTGVPLISETTKDKIVSNDGTIALWRDVSYNQVNDLAVFDLFLAANSSNTIMISAARSYASVFLPAGVAPLSYSDGFTIHNASEYTIAIRTTFGKLVVAVLPGGTCRAVLAGLVDFEGDWAISGTGLQPIFIKNSVLIPNSEAILNNNVIGVNPVYTVKLDDSRIFSLALTANSTFICLVHENRADDGPAFDTLPALNQASPFIFTPANSVIQLVAKVAPNVIGIFTGTDIYTLYITGTAITTLSSSLSAFTASGRTGIEGSPGVKQLAESPGLFVVTKTTVAATIVSFSVVTISISGVISVGTAATTALLGTLGSLDFTPITSASFVVVQTTVATASDIAITKFVITPSVSPPTSVVTTLVLEAATLLYLGTAKVITIVPDIDPDICMIVAAQTGNFMRAICVKGCLPSNTLSHELLTSKQLDGANAITLNTTLTLGQMPTRHNLRSIGPGKFQYIFQGLNNYIKIINMYIDTTTTSTAITLNTYTTSAKNITGIWSILPDFFPNNSRECFLVAHGNPSAAYSGIISYKNNTEGGLDFSGLTYPNGELLNLTIGTSILVTGSGWVLISIAYPTAATTVAVTNNSYALFQCFPLGVVKYHSTISLPINTTVSSAYNATLIENNRITLVCNSNDYDAVKNIPFKRMVCLEFAINQSI
jgi:hypothetical protein